MATIIKSISFQNFYNYFGEFQDNTFEFTTGINIISADNNMGKSKFYNGILWLLKDQVYDSDDKKFKPVGSSFVRMASSKAKSIGDPFTMAIRIIYTNGKEEYEVTKSVKLKKEGTSWNPSGQIVEVSETSHGATTPIYDTTKQNKVIENIIPVQLRDYALLQGESMEEIVDLSSKAGLQSTIETLADIGDIVNIKATSTQLTKLAHALYTEQQSKNTKQDAETQRLISEKETLEKRIASTRDDIDRTQNELSVAKETKEKFEALIENASSRQSFRSEIKSKEDEIKRLKDAKKAKEFGITSMIFSERPWLLLGQDDALVQFVQKRDDLVKERAFKHIQKEMKKDPSTILLPEGSPDVPSLQRMLKNEICEVCGRPALKGSQEWLNIKKLIDRPKEVVLETKNDFTKFFSDIQISVGGIGTSDHIMMAIAKYRQELDELCAKIEAKEGELDEIRTRFYNVGGTANNEDKDKANLNEYNLATKNIGKFTEDLERYKENIRRWEIRVQQIDDLLQQRTIGGSVQKYKDLKELMACVEQLFESTKERIFDRILNDLRIVANEKYKDLLKGNPVKGGTLTFNKQSDGTVRVSIKNDEDGELTGLGTGFQRMKQLSIIMAIISTKIGDQTFDYPFISDAPFSEFGDNFIKNFFRIAPGVFTQSIIMVKDLYDVNDDSHMNPLGHDIYNKMKKGEIPGSFYANYIEERSDVTSLVTKTKRYI